MCHGTLNYCHSPLIWLRHFSADLCLGKMQMICQELESQLHISETVCIYLHLFLYLSVYVLRSEALKVKVRGVESYGVLKSKWHVKG